MANIIFLPIIPWTNITVQRPHHLGRLMAADGHTVRYISAHITGRDVRNWGQGISEHFLKHAQYRVFKQGHERTDYFTRTLSAMKPDVILVNAPYWSDIAISLRAETGAKIIYDVLDHFEGFEDLARMDGLTDAHTRLLAGADLITHTAMNLCPDRSGTLYLPNACDFNHWNMDRKPGGPAGFFGVKAYWVDDSIMRGIPDLVQVGHGTKRGPVPNSDLPKIACQWGCGLIPFGDHPITHTVNPVKLYEYMALGLPVVASKLPEIEYLAACMPVSISPTLCDVGATWLDSVRTAIESDTKALIGQRKLWASGQTWDDRYRLLRVHL